MTSMMEKQTLVIDGTTSEVAYYVPPPSVPSRIVGARVTANAAQSSAAPVSVGKEGATNQAFSLDLNGKDAKVVHQLTENGTDAEMAAEYNNDVPAQVLVNLGSSSAKVVMEIWFDPYVIGQGQNSIY